MPTAIPPVLAPYMQSCLRNPSPTLVTSVLDTPANWLVLRFIKAALEGVDSEIEVVQNERVLSPIIFASFLHSYDFWTELSKRLGLDFPTLVAKKQLAYIDGLSVGLNVPQPTAKTIRPKTYSLADISHAIATANTALSTSTTLSNRPTIIFDGLDLILASQPDISATSLTSFFTEISGQFSNTIITLSADSPLLHNIEAGATPLELDHSVFVRSVAHQSAWVLQLRPLETGHAKDVSGVLQISKGGADAVQDEQLADGEWLYQVKGDGSVRVWSRGSE